MQLTRLTFKLHGFLGLYHRRHTTVWAVDLAAFVTPSPSQVACTAYCNCSSIDSGASVTPSPSGSPEAGIVIVTVA
ncbi:MAG: hypothetical protein IPN46_08400 [Saprospiraceae bacterium]|nr:hypothetical protein [Saprospiraceae bacterium]